MSVHHPDILFFDLEVHPKAVPRKLLRTGIYWNGARQHFSGTDQLHQITQTLKAATCICGHNIVHHDIPFLAQEGSFEGIKDIPAIDTLLLSPLLRPHLSTHKLDKDYLPETFQQPDPALDAQLSSELLDALVLAWQALSSEFKQIIKTLLLGQAGFSPFWKYFGVDTPTSSDLPGSINTYFKNKLCSNVDYHPYISQLPIELAYVLAILDSGQDTIYTPSWIVFQYQRIEEVFNALRTTPCDQPNCKWCAVKLNPHKGLVGLFNYEEFRRFEGDAEGAMPLQERAVRGALQGESLIVLFPTGGGKSLTFQLPALMRGRLTGSLTVVISPLVALMKDQIDVLRAKGIANAVAINGLLSPLERAEAFEKVANGTVNLLYISPEALRSNSILNLLKYRPIDRFVIDEAHCFSAWGQDFRVDYFYIGKFIAKLMSDKKLSTTIPVSCFTATARPEVIQDINAYFKKHLDLRLIAYSTQEERTNLFFEAVQAKEGEERIEQIIELLGPFPKPTIVYVSRTATAEKIATQLKRRKLLAAHYHGKMDVEDKKKVLDAFKAGDLNVIVATSAFGMGVDKDNVEMVIHYEVSQSLENYAQEAGRGGRNKDLHARCIVLYREEDLDKHFALLKLTMLSKPDVQQIWRAIQSFKHQELTKTCLELAKRAGWDTELDDLETKVKAAINALEIAGYVDRSQNSPQVFPSSIHARNLEQALDVVKQFAYKFQGQQQEHAKRILKYIFGKVEARIDYMADHLSIEDREIREVLGILHEIGIISEGMDVTLKIPERSQQSYKAHRFLEPAFIAFLHHHKQGDQITLDLKDVNEELSTEDRTTEISHLIDYLRLWEWEAWIKKSRKKANTYLYEITFKKDAAEIDLHIKERLALGEFILTYLQKHGLFEFALKDLKEKLETENMFMPRAELRVYTKALLYLNDIRAIELMGGILIHKNSLRLKRNELSNQKQYTVEDYSTLDKHYKQRIQQIHIMGEYAKRLLQNATQARTLLSAYFRMDFKDFLKAYFPGRFSELNRTITPERYDRIFKNLSPEQLAPVNDLDSPSILIAAGPGSGKTRALVSKMAAILVLEEARAESFLMLSFSRPAVLELRERLGKILPELARKVSILTFHAFAFQLLSKAGTLEKSDTVIELATQAIQNDQVDPRLVSSRTAILVDEFQDISMREWDFLTAILDKAVGCKLIAVGDDDQAINGFRGGSSIYMRKVMSRDKAKAYFLTTNYRSTQRLLQFANAFLQLIPGHDRIKSQQPLTAHKTAEGHLALRYYNQGHIIPALVQVLKQQSQAGTTAILCSTNQEVLQVAALLRLNGIPAQPLSYRKEFKLWNIVELAYFTKRITKSPADTHGLIAPETWKSAFQDMNQFYATSSDLALAQAAIKDFAKEHSAFYLSDWKAFLTTIQPEDYFQAQPDKVYTSTIHKAKGKEFDHVHLLLQDREPQTAEDLRLIYVGITRAIQTLMIHTKLHAFDRLPYRNGEYTVQPGSPEPAKEIELECSLKDVNLDQFIRIDLAHKPIGLRSGQALVCYPDSQVISLLGWTFPFSYRFRERIRALTNLGYTIHSAHIAHIIWWKKQTQDIAPVQVVLPRIRMQRP